MQYTAKGDYNRHFELRDEQDHMLGTLDYTNWFSIKAEITAGEQRWQISPANIWHTALDITNADLKVGDMRLSWSGGYIIDLEAGPTYRIKRTGFWRNNFALIDADEKEVALLQAHYEWTQLRFSYKIELDETPAQSEKILLALLLVYGAILSTAPGRGRSILKAKKL